MAGGRKPNNGHVTRPQGGVHNTPRAYRYINEVGSDGWVSLRKDGGTTPIPLSKYTKLERRGVKDGRVQYIVIDGPSKGQKGSMAEADAKKFIGRKAPTQGVIQITVAYGGHDPAWKSDIRNETLDQQFATLTVDKISVKITMNSIWGGTYSPLPAGDYDVMVPDAPHDKAMTAKYVSAVPALRFDRAWFPIKFGNNSRYVHVGHLSEGCVTVTEISKWNDIHEALASHRDSTGMLVAKLKVTGKPTHP